MNPSAEALALAVKLSGHTSCQKKYANVASSGSVCSGCLGDAVTIEALAAIQKTQ